MSTFLDEIALDIISRHDGPSLSRSLFILPSKRAGGFLKKSLAKHIDKPILSPRIISVEEFIGEISGLQTLNITEQYFLLYQAYLNSTIKNKDDYHGFSHWAGQLIQDFNEIDRHLVEPDRFFSYMSELKKLRTWDVKGGESIILTNYLSFWRELKTVYLDFQTLLLTNGRGYQGLIYRKAHDKLQDFLKETDYYRFFFVGFNALNTAESNIIQYMLHHAETEIHWDLDAFLFGDKVHSASFFIRKYAREWTFYKERPLKGISKNYLSNKDIQIVGAPKNVSQVKYVGKILEKEYDSQSKIALVLSDEALLHPILNSMPYGVEDINVTMGSPLVNTLLNDFFDGLLKMHIKKSNKGFFYQELLYVLNNPYASLFLTRDGIDYSKKIRFYIEKYNWSYLNTSLLAEKNLAPESLIDSIFFDCSDSAKDFIFSCSALVRTLQNEKKAIEGPIAKKFSEIFEKLREYIATYPFIGNLNSLSQVYSDLVANEKLDYHGSPDKGLQIMGMLESRNLDFDTVIITSVNEGILPSGKTNNSFIPYDVKREFGLPTYREKDAVYAYHFYRLLQRAKKIFILYNTEPDVLDGGEKSRFISQLLTDGNIKGMIHHSIVSPGLDIIQKKPFSIQKTEVLMDELKQISQKGFSPTSLSTYISNPLDFYKQKVLRINEPESFEESMAPNIFGTIVHDVLEVLYQPMLEKVLNNDVLLQAKMQLPTILREIFLKTLPGSIITEGKNLIVYNVILKYLENFLEQEIEESKKHQIKILALEQKLSCQIFIPNHDFPITLKGTLDRVDEKDGQLRIIDYKTGNIVPSEVELMDWEKIIEPKHNKAFQLLCYAKMYIETTKVAPVEVGLIPLKKKNTQLLRFATKETSRGPRNFSITKDVIQEFDRHLQKLILEILNPEIPFTEKEE